MYRYFSINLLTVPYLWVFLLFCHVYTFWWSHIMSTDPSGDFCDERALEMRTQRNDNSNSNNKKTARLILSLVHILLHAKWFQSNEVDSKHCSKCNVTNWNCLDERRCGEDQTHKVLYHADSFGRAVRYYVQHTMFGVETLRRTIRLFQSIGGTNLDSVYPNCRKVMKGYD